MLISLQLLAPGDSSGEVRNNGHYDVFPYKYYGYSKAPRNAREGNSPVAQNRDPAALVQPMILRDIRPRYICFVDDDEANDSDFSCESVAMWEETHPNQPLPYIFIAYTTMQFDHDVEADMYALHSIAIRATRAAGLRAFWVGASCMPDGDDEDIYRISDVIRGAHSMIIAIGSQSSADAGVHKTKLAQWGLRMWTYQEVLLSPSKQSINVWSRDGRHVQSMAKIECPALLWHDSHISRELIDHYEGTLQLSHLELVTLALSCLFNRQTGDKTEGDQSYANGDQSYALMGLLRVRPKVDRDDSAFQAFARLSLANDSDQLLERLMCTLPISPAEKWHTMSDAWDAKLWDIYPTCQVAGVGPGDTVVIVSRSHLSLTSADSIAGWPARRECPVEGIRQGSQSDEVDMGTLLPSGHSVSFVVSPILVASALTSGRRHVTPLFFFGGIALVVVGADRSDSASKTAGALMLVYAILVCLLSPFALKVIYGGKFWHTQVRILPARADNELICWDSPGFSGSKATWTSKRSSARSSVCVSVGLSGPLTHPHYPGTIKTSSANAKGSIRLMLTMTPRCSSTWPGRLDQVISASSP